MPTSNDSYWDELGVAWRATNADLNAITPKLKTRLRWQGFGMLAIVVVGIPLSVAGLILGLYTLWIGWAHHVWFFLTRGVAIVWMSYLLALASWSLHTGMRGYTGSLMEMIDGSIMRAEGLSRAVRMGYWGCAISVVFGVVGYGIRARFYHPAAMSPVGPLLLLGVSCMALYLYHWHVANDLARFKYLRGALARDTL